MNIINAAIGNLIKIKSIELINTFIAQNPQYRNMIYSMLEYFDENIITKLGYLINYDKTLISFLMDAYLSKNFAYFTRIINDYKYDLSDIYDHEQATILLAKILLNNIFEPEETSDLLQYVHDASGGIPVYILQNMVLYINDLITIDDLEYLKDKSSLYQQIYDIKTELQSNTSTRIDLNTDNVNIILYYDPEMWENLFFDAIDERQTNIVDLLFKHIANNNVVDQFTDEHGEYIYKYGNRDMITLYEDFANSYFNPYLTMSI